MCGKKYLFWILYFFIILGSYSFSCENINYYYDLLGDAKRAVWWWGVYSGQYLKHVFSCIVNILFAFVLKGIIFAYLKNIKILLKYFEWIHFKPQFSANSFTTCCFYYYLNFILQFIFFTN